MANQPVRSQTVSVDAPIGGWNAYDSMDNMPPDCAIILDNLIPSAGSVDSRAGHEVYVDLGTGSPVETVANLNTDKVNYLIAASGGGVWRIEHNPVVSTNIKPATTFQSDRWQKTNFRSVGEQGVLILCNGVNKAQKIVDPYTDVVDVSFTVDNGSGTQVTYDDSEFIGVCNFKGRCYYWKDNDNSFWYCQARSYQGEIKEFDLGAVAQEGGKIKFITTWTQQDSGDGKDDFIVFVMDTGEILVYQGDDPESIGFFEMVGRYTTAEPLSVRGHSKYGADTIIMTKDGYVALSTIVQQGRVSDVPAFSRLITDAIQKKTRTNSGFFGWDAELFSRDGLFIFNVPLAETGIGFNQHVLNTTTMRWCRFTDIKMSCMTVNNERLYGGDPVGNVLLVLDGTSDRGNAIKHTALPAFNYLGNAGVHKHISAAQIISTHPEPWNIELTGYADFNYRFPPILISPPPRRYATWSVLPATPAAAVGSYWDEDYWAVGDEPFTTKGWQNVSAFGYAVSVMVRFLTINGIIKWRSSTIRFNAAGAQ